MRISHKVIKEEFNRAEIAYDFCWKVLVDIKTKNIKDKDYANRMLLFQDHLATSIFNLQFIRDKIILEEKNYIKNKVKYKIEWFTAKLRLLSKFKKNIDLVVNMAKDLGDSFAYFFYQFEPDLLNEHLSHQVVVNHTAGSGELGELAFIKEYKHFDSQFTLFHGITNILRYGDFSFVDLLTLRITRIGELKTKLLDDGGLQAKLFLIDREKLENNSTKLPLPEERSKDRRERQLHGIIKFLGPKEKSPGIDRTVINESYADQVGQMINECKINGHLARQLSPGLEFICFKFKKSSFYHKMFIRKLDEDKTKLEEMLNQIVSNLIKPGEQRNSLVISQLLVVDDKFDPCIPGVLPLFWSSMENDALKQIYFKESHVISMINPVHLILDVEKMGFQVESKHSHKPVKTPGQSLALIQRFDLFIGYIIRHLMTEDFVLDFIREIKNSQYWGTTAKITMTPQQRMTL